MFEIVLVLLLLLLQATTISESLSLQRTSAGRFAGLQVD